MRSILVLCLTAVVCAQWDPNNVPNHSTIVHLFEWPYASIAEECENWLGPNGFGGIQISPPTENSVIANRPWWERYQPISYIFTTRSGSEAQLADMISRCNAVGVRVYPDVVFNHMTGPGATAVGTAGSTAEPDNKIYPAVPYGPTDFHTSCLLSDWNDPMQVRECELYGLKDLAQNQDHVRIKILEMLNKLIDLGVAGFRVDVAKNMWPQDLEIIYGNMNDLNIQHGFAPNSRPMLIQEVSDLDGNGPSPSEYFYLGRVTEFEQGKQLGSAFMGQTSLSMLQNFGENLVPDGNALCFIDNHDTQRAQGYNILTYKNPRPYRMATAFELAWPYGYPRMMSSFDFTNFDMGPPHDDNDNIVGPGSNADGSCTNGWVCEHRWRQMYNMVAFRNTVEGTVVRNWWDNGNNQIAFCRGNKGFIAFNNEGTDMNINLQTCLPPGTYCDVISGSKTGSTCSGKIVTVTNLGTADIIINTNEEDGILAIHVNAML